MPGGKVGGIGDVIRDLPAALQKRGHQCTVLMPGYGALSQLPGTKKIAVLRTSFGGAAVSVAVHRLASPDSGVTCLVLEHPGFAPCGAGRIYCDDPDDRPFATDASKFALFSAAAASYVAGLQQKPALVHLNDWHSSLYLLLREFDPSFKALKSVRTVFTIHNLALQGIRPLAQDPSSLEAWFPQLKYKRAVVIDPRYGNCLNPMAIGIRLADAVNTVSPTYAREILGAAGEGLQQDLKLAAKEGRLTGILNGCEYPARAGRAPSWTQFRKLAGKGLEAWMSRQPIIHSAHYFAERALARLPRSRPQTILTSVGRLTEQKATLFLEPVDGAETALDHILDRLGDAGWLLILGSGDPAIEAALTRMSVTRNNLLFLNGYDEALSAALYEIGDLFLMPSIFEPCGISQMLAMRSRQPCVVNDVGGLHDTVVNRKNGFVFSGKTSAQQAHNFVAAVGEAVQMQREQPATYKAISKAAGAARFSWDAAAQQYEEGLYRD